MKFKIQSRVRTLFRKCKDDSKWKTAASFDNEVDALKSWQNITAPNKIRYRLSYRLCESDVVLKQVVYETTK